MNTSFCILHSVFCVLYFLFCILYSAFCILYSVFCICILYSVYCILYSVLCILYFVLLVLSLRAWVRKKFGTANRISAYCENIGSANHKSANCHTCERSANVANFVCKFADLLFADQPPLQICHRYQPKQRYWREIYGVIDTGDVPWLANISANFEKIRNGPIVIFRGLGEADSGKKSDAKNLVTLSL